MEAPSTKKPRLEVDNTLETRAVLSDDYTQEIPKEIMYISRIQHKQQISPIMQELCKLLPLPSTLQHLKRVNGSDILICKKDDCKWPTIEEHLREAQLTCQVVHWLSANTCEIAVPSLPPKLRWQYEIVHKVWPCKFHPDKYMESLYACSNFAEEERRFHHKIAKLLRRLSDKLHNKPTALCIDPRTNAIVAIADSKTHLNPVMHAPMVLIDYVARSQKSGAWNTKFENEEFLQNLDNDTDAKVSMAGITKFFHETVRNDDEMKDFTFGAENLRSNAVKLTDAALAEGCDNLAKYGPYLSTGYYVFLSDEPCLMCSMALVHSRVKRVFFVRPSKDGALCSKFKLHTVRELNHHYEVFQICTENVPRT